MFDPRSSRSRPPSIARFPLRGRRSCSVLPPPSLRIGILTLQPTFWRPVLTSPYRPSRRNLRSLLPDVLVDGRSLAKTDPGGGRVQGHLLHEQGGDQRRDQ